MITNERQYKITRSETKRLETAAAELAQRPSDPITSLSLDALRSQIEDLHAQLVEYERLRSGASSVFAVTSLAELPRDLIRARIAKGFTQRQLAEKLGLKEQQIQRYESSEYSGASVARMLEIAEALDLDVAGSSDPRTTCVAPRPQQIDSEIDWAEFPVREMYMRKWFVDFRGSLSAALQNADDLVSHYIGAHVRTPALALHRKHVRAGSTLDEYSLLAWECRILDLASRVDLENSYSPELLTPDWIESLVRLSQYEDGPTQAVHMLASAGIPLVFEPHLPGTHLDGATLLKDDTPVIGMTLRYDRLDSFWFVLLHELFHAVKHLKKGKLTGTFDDLEAPGQDAIEKEADALAGEALLPTALWNRAVARYVRTPATVTALAHELHRHPAIIAGRIRHEADNYVILSDLIGNGQVRKQFVNPECRH